MVDFILKVLLNVKSSSLMKFIQTRSEIQTKKKERPLENWKFWSPENFTFKKTTSMDTLLDVINFIQERIRVLNLKLDEFKNQLSNPNIIAQYKRELPKGAQLPVKVIGNAHGKVIIIRPTLKEVQYILIIENLLECSTNQLNYILNDR